MKFDKYSNIHERLTSNEEVKPRSLKKETERIQSIFNNNPRYHKVMSLP